MADPDGQTPDNLINQLAADPTRFDLFMALRLLECHYRDRPRIGYASSPAQEPVRIGQNPHLIFAPSNLESFKYQGPDRPVRLVQRGFGLMGPNGPMPIHLTEFAWERILHHGDPTVTAFLNVFNHRLVCLFYRSWSANQKTLDLDRPEDQRFAFYIGSLLGIGMEALLGRDAVPDKAKLYFTGRLSCPTRNAEGLESILQSFFEIPTQVQTFVGRWINLPPDSVCKLGDSRETGCLGVNAIVGSRFWESQLSFRIRMGPMSLSDYERMLPGGDAYERLRYWVLNYVDKHYLWDVQLTLKADEVPAIRLGAFGRVGWTTWIKSRPTPQDAEDLLLNPPGI